MSCLLDSVQRRVTICITSAYKCTKQENVGNRLYLSTLKVRRTNHKLILFYKFKYGLLPKYLSDLCLPQILGKTNYCLRNVNGIQMINTHKTYCLK